MSRSTPTAPGATSSTTPCPPPRRLAQGVTVNEVFHYTATDTNNATSDATLTIAVTGTNNAPVALADTNTGPAVTASGVNPGNTVFAGNPNATGNVLTNDTDVDTGDTLSVAAVSSVSGNVNTAVLGTYGRVTINTNGTWSYALDNTLPATQALAQGVTVNEVFHYTATDTNNATSDATLTIAVTGTNNAPVALADTNTGPAVTASGVNPGNTAFAGNPNATGNVLTNDSDVDTGDSLTVAAVNSVAGNVNTAVLGTYGRVTINTNGTWSYVLDNTLPATQALAQGVTVNEVFHYTATDTNNATSDATLTIAVTGTNNAPVVTAGQTYSVPELSPAGTVVNTVLATDADVPHTLTYAFAGGNTGGAFAIDSNTGVITVSDPYVLNFEATQHLQPHGHSDR